jgi:hypothetical protein
MEASHKLKMGAGMPVVHACNPSYSGGRDQEDHGLPAQANNSRDPISKKNPITKDGW